MLRANPSSSSSLWSIRLLTFLLAGLAAASISFWVLQWPAKTPGSLNLVTTTRDVPIDSGKVALLLGANPAAGKTPTANISSAYKLIGVIAEGGAGHQGSRGSALIAVNGALAKPYRVGDEVADGLLLQSVKARRVMLGRDGQTNDAIMLELPQLPGMSDVP
jgi:general secretion pathway protein C